MIATHNPPPERTTAAVYFICVRASRVRRRGRVVAMLTRSDLLAAHRVRLREVADAEPPVALPGWRR